MELKDILETKPETPKCSDNQEAGDCLIWTAKTGWNRVPISQEK